MLAIIGGTGLTQLDNLEIKRRLIAINDVERHFLSDRINSI